MNKKKRIIITGISKGIGYAIGKDLLDSGHHVIGISRSKNPLFSHDNYTPFPLDLTDIDQLEDKLNALKKDLRTFCEDDETDCLDLQIDALILCAGKGLFGHLEQMSTEQIHSLFKLNAISPMIVTKCFLPLMKKEGKGDIIFIGSESALQGKKKSTAYSATKFALRGFVQALRDECKKANVRVTIINPGMVKTPFFDGLNFEPGKDLNEHIVADDIAGIVKSLLDMRHGTCIDEINLSPQKNKVCFKMSH